MREEEREGRGIERGRKGQHFSSEMVKTIEYSLPLMSQNLTVPSSWL